MDTHQPQVKVLGDRGVRETGIQPVWPWLSRESVKMDRIREDIVQGGWARKQQ